MKNESNQEDARNVTLSVEELEAVLNRVLNSHETHATHHRWIESQIETQAARREMYKKAAESAIQWSVVGVLAALWFFFTHGSWPK